MISPNTPPGTKVVCINAGSSDQYNPPTHRLRVDAFNARHWLVTGKVYTVEAINISPKRRIVCVRLVEVPDRSAVVKMKDHPNYRDLGYNIKRFRYLDLPKSITGLLTVTPADKKKLLEVE